MTDEKTRIVTDLRSLADRIRDQGQATAIYHATTIEKLMREAADENSASTEAHERTKSGARTLGEIIKQQCDDIVKITNSQDLIGDDGDGDWEAVWGRAFDMRAKLDAFSALTVPDGDVRERLVESIAGGTISIPGGYGELARDDAESIVDTILGDPALSRAAAPAPAEQFSYVEKWVDGSGVYERITFGSASEAREWLRNRADGLAAFNAEADAEADRLEASVERRTTYSPGPWEPLPVGGETDGK